METPASYTASGGFYTKLSFDYNWEGKCIARHLWTGGTPSSPTFVSSKRWLYDGWNPVAEFTATAHDIETGATAAALNRYAWGLDLGDTGEGIARPGQMLQRAGGVGGLLLQTTVSGPVLERPSYDGNGNIVAWTKSTAAAPTVRREYDAFGNVVMSEGTNPSEFGYSTKLEDPRSGLVYYGYRYYQPEHGRWISRDPIEERGGVNLYAFVSNFPTQNTDVLGLAEEGSSSDYTTGDDDNVHVSIAGAGSCSSNYSGKCDGELEAKLYVKIKVNNTKDSDANDVMKEDDAADAFLTANGVRRRLNPHTSTGAAMERDTEVVVGKIPSKGGTISGTATIDANRRMGASGTAAPSTISFYKVIYTLTIECCGRVVAARATAEDLPVIDPDPPLWGPSGFRLESADEDNWWSK